MSQPRVAPRWSAGRRRQRRSRSDPHDRTDHEAVEKLGDLSDGAFAAMLEPPSEHLDQARYAEDDGEVGGQPGSRSTSELSLIHI